MSVPSPGQLAGQVQQLQLQAPLRPQRKCAEVCLELLSIEAVQLFSGKQYGPSAAAALQAVGFRVGAQLAER